METKFTLGPWKAQKDEVMISGSLRTVIEISSEDCVLWLAYVQGGRARCEDDANLIAAAPDLYAALESVCQIWGNNDDQWFQGDMDSAVTEARAALAKARGERS